MLKECVLDARYKAVQRQFDPNKPEQYGSTLDLVYSDEVVHEMISHELKSGSDLAPKDAQLALYESGLVTKFGDQLFDWRVSPTLLLSRGHHPKLVQELLGYASVATTLDRYSHVLPGMGDQTAVAREAALS